jgi:molybdopterin-biosynthesis enzyme MoeA-like protein
MDIILPERYFGELFRRQGLPRERAHAIHDCLSDLLRVLNSSAHRQADYCLLEG